MRPERTLSSPLLNVSDPVTVCPATEGTAEKTDIDMTAIAKTACAKRRELSLPVLSRARTSPDILGIFEN